MILDSLVENKDGKALKSKFFRKDTIKELEEAIKDEVSRKVVIQSPPPKETKIDSKKKALEVLENKVKEPLYDLLQADAIAKDPFVITLGTNKITDALLRTPPEMYVLALGAGLTSLVAHKDVKKAAKYTGMMLAESIAMSNLNQAYAHYSRISNTLVIPFAMDTMFTTTMAHEYTHAIQAKNEITNWSKLIVEGHAEATALEACEDIGMRNKDIRMVNFSRFRKQSRMMISYYHLCKQFSQEPAFQIKNPGKIIPKANIYDNGTAIMEMAKKQHGKDVYSKVLKGDYSVLGL